MEEWKDIPEFKGHYQASNIGRIKSLERIDHGVRKVKERILIPRINNTGRFYVNLCRKGKSKSYQVSRLILLAFVGKCPDNYECMHLDDNPLNNNINNLRWGTHSENVRMMHAHGRANPANHKGEKSSTAKLHLSDVIRIKDIAKNIIVERGYWAKLSRSLGVNKSTIYDIIKNRTWVES